MCRYTGFLSIFFVLDVFEIIMEKNGFYKSNPIKGM